MLACGWPPRRRGPSDRWSGAPWERRWRTRPCRCFLGAGPRCPTPGQRAPRDSWLAGLAVSSTDSIVWLSIILVTMLSGQCLQRPHGLDHAAGKERALDGGLHVAALVAVVAAVRPAKHCRANDAGCRCQSGTSQNARRQKHLQSGLKRGRESISAGRLGGSRASSG